MFTKAIQGFKVYKLWSKAWDVVTHWEDNVGTVDGVPVKSAWASKINWTQAVTVAGSLLAMFGLDLTVEQKASLVSGITVFGAIVTWAFRTWFNNSVTK